MKDFLLAITKLLCAVLLLPILISCVITFKNHLSVYPATFSEFFLWGATGFLLIFLFLYQFWGVFDFGQMAMGQMTKIMAPFDALIIKMVSFYLILIIVAFFITVNFFNVTTSSPYFMFFAGFFSAMHILLVSQQLQEEEKTPVKPSYLLWMSIIFIFNIFMIVLSLDLITKAFTFPSFFSDVVSGAYQIYLDSWARIQEIVKTIREIKITKA